MADRTPIEWSDATWNPLGGCTRVDDACKNCYAEIMAARFSGPGQWGEGLARIVRGANGTVDHRWTGKLRLNEAALDRPLRWRKPRRIFVNSTSDLFHESVPFEWIDRVFAVMALCPQHTFQVLTKRPERMRAYFADPGTADRIALAIGQVADPSPEAEFSAQMRVSAMPLTNVWLGTSISEQASADLRIPDLLATPAAVRFVSAEPLLGPVDLTFITHLRYGQVCALTGYLGTGMYGDYGPRLNLVIVGGESGPGARPMHPDWPRGLRDQCVAAGVKFFFKQWGEYEADQIGPEDLRSIHHPPGHVIFRKVGKARAGRLLDGREWNQMPGVA